MKYIYIPYGISWAVFLGSVFIGQYHNAASAKHAADSFNEEVA